MGGARSFANRALDDAAKVLVHPLEGHHVEAQGLALHVRPLAAAGQIDNPGAPAVEREAEEEL
jgi:hypothetical protein